MLQTLNCFYFDLRDYEVAFHILKTNFIERLLTRKRTKNKYYIRIAGESPELILCKSKYANEYIFRKDRDTFGTNILYFEDPTEPQELLSNLYNNRYPNADNVLFSTKDLRNL
jgi:hypothetical protein